MRVALASIALATGVLLSAPSLAATVTSTTGQLSINRGAGFQPVAGAAEANAGDAVMAGPGSSGRIAYADGCQIPVDPGKVITVTAQSPCAAFAQAGGQPDDTMGYVVGAGMAVVVGVSIYLGTRDNNGASPASP